MDIKKVLESKTKIRFQDCDPFNHLNNASYINYLINAREDQLIQNYGLDIYKMGRTMGKSWVVGTNQIAYIRPAFLMEEVIIDSQLLHFSNNKLLVEMRMWNNEKTKIKAMMWSSFVHFNLLKQKTETHTEDLINLFENALNPVEEKTFEARVLALKMKKEKA